MSFLPGLLVGEIFGEYDARRNEAAARFSGLVMDEIAAGRFRIDGRRMGASHVNFHRPHVGLVVSIPLSDRDLDILRPAKPIEFGCELFGDGDESGEPREQSSAEPPSAEPPSAEPPSTEPPSTAPPSTEPPSTEPRRRTVQVLLSAAHDRFASAAARALQPAVRVLLEACQAKARRCEGVVNVGPDTRSMQFEFSAEELMRLVPDRGDPVLALQLACQDGGAANVVRLYRMDMPHRPSTQQTRYRVVLSEPNKEELPLDLGQ